MGYVLIISEEASSNIRNTVDYLKREWSKKSVLKFQNDLLDSFNRIVTNPLSFLLVDSKPEIRKCKASKYSSAYFRIKGNEIENITVFDHRRDPKRLKEVFDKAE